MAFLLNFLGMNLYVADSNNKVIRQNNLTTSSVMTLGGGNIIALVSLKIIRYLKFLILSFLAQISILL
jgi:hypothetical protein